MPLFRNLFVFSMSDMLLRGTSGENAPKSPWRQFGHATVRCSPQQWPVLEEQLDRFGSRSVLAADLWIELGADFDYAHRSGGLRVDAVPERYYNEIRPQQNTTRQNLRRWIACIAPALMVC
jgi:hypothetical protein